MFLRYRIIQVGQKILKRRWPKKYFITLFTSNSKLFRLNLTQRVMGSPSLVYYRVSQSLHYFQKKYRLPDKHICCTECMVPQCLLPSPVLAHRWQFTLIADNGRNQCICAANCLHWQRKERTCTSATSSEPARDSSWWLNPTTVGQMASPQPEGDLRDHHQ